MRLNGLDLNLLVALDALLEEQQVTRAGERTRLTQSAMSDAPRAAATALRRRTIGPPRQPTAAHAAGRGAAGEGGRGARQRTPSVRAPPSTRSRATASSGSLRPASVWS